MQPSDSREKMIKHAIIRIYRSYRMIPRKIGYVFLEC